MSPIFGIMLLGGFCGIPLSLVTMVFKKTRNKPLKNTLIAFGITTTCFLIAFVRVFFIG